MKEPLIGLLCIWNIAVFSFYGADKLFSMRGKQRISERNLLLCAFFMGAFGALCGMMIFHHKTAKLRFKLSIPFACVCQAIFWRFFFVFAM